MSLANPIFEGHLLEYRESEYVISGSREFVKVIVRALSKVVRWSEFEHAKGAVQNSHENNVTS